MPDSQFSVPHLSPLTTHFLYHLEGAETVPHLGDHFRTTNVGFLVDSCVKNACSLLCVCFWLKPFELSSGKVLEGGPLLLVCKEGRLPQRLKGRLAFLFKEKDGIPFLDKGKELLAPLLSQR